MNHSQEPPLTAAEDKLNGLALLLYTKAKDVGLINKSSRSNKKLDCVL